MSIRSSSNPEGSNAPPQRGRGLGLIIPSTSGVPPQDEHASPTSPIPRLKEIITHIINSHSRAPNPQVQQPPPQLPNVTNNPPQGAVPNTPTQLTFDPQNVSAPAESSKTPGKSAPTKIDQNTAFWEAYNKAGDIEDKEFVKTSGGDLDVLLIFAGLFSATNTAFIIESYKSLKADPIDETNKLLRSLFNATVDASHATIDDPPFTATTRDIRINACFFASLCCSLTAAFGAVLAKQWLTQYDRDGGGLLKTPSARGQERQRKYEGRDKWHLEDVIVTLPTLLQFSLFFFFIGLVDFLWILNDIITGIVLGFTVATFLLYVITIAISVFFESAPFQTRLSPLLRSPLRRLWSIITRVASQGLAGFDEVRAKVERNANIPCISYLLERVTKPEDLEIVAEAFVSLFDDPKAVAITNPFIDFHFKPTRGKVWNAPSLYGTARSSVLKILSVLVKKWKDQKVIRTPLYYLETASLFSDLPKELRKAFLADPADVDSCRCIANILLALRPDCPSSPSGEQEMTAWEDEWLDDEVTKNLEGKDGAVRNTLMMMNLATWGSAKRSLAWDIVKEAKKRNTRLKKIIHSVVWKEISSIELERASDGLSSLSLLEWFAVSDDMDGLADALEALPRGSDAVVIAAQPLIGTLVETIVTFHLRPALDGWWRLPGLHDQHRGSLLRILRVIIVRWRYLERNLNPKCASFQLLHPFIASLRAELWAAFQAAPEDARANQMIIDICKNLPAPISFSDDEVSITAMRSLGTELSRVFHDDQAQLPMLRNCFSLLCSNAETLISLANFHAIRLSPGNSRVLPDYLRSSMWNGDTPTDLGDFWRVTLRVQLLPTCFPGDLRNLRFAKYLDLWFKRFARHEVDAQNDIEVPQQPTEEVAEQKRLYWIYLIALRNLLTDQESNDWTNELKDHGHLSHILEILHSCSASAPLALQLFLSLWTNDTSDEASYLTAKGIKGVTNALTAGNLPLGLMSLDIQMYSECARGNAVPHEKWSEAISEQLMQDMGQMMEQLHSYLVAAIQRGLIDSASLDAALAKYDSWSGEVDGHSRTGKFRRLSEELGKVRMSFKDVQKTVAETPQSALSD